MLIDPEEWRISIVSRTEELNRILDPKPIVTREGVRFHANPLLIRRERERTPRPDEMARDNSYQGEEDRRANRKASRASMDYGSDDRIKVEKPAAVQAKSAADLDMREAVKQDAERAAAVVETTTDKPLATPLATEQPAARVIASEEVTAGVDEDAVSKVVDEIVRERINAGAAATK
jgi:hypothetical protein